MQLREDQFQINVDITGVPLPYCFSWSAFEGADLEASDVFTRPGGMLPGRSLGGPTKRTDGTAKRQYTPELHAYMGALEQVCGVNSTGTSGAGTVTISYRPLDGNGKPISGADFNHLRGIIKQVTRPNYEANAEAAAFLTLVFAMDTESFSSSAGVVAYGAAGFGV